MSRQQRAFYEPVASLIKRHLRIAVPLLSLLLIMSCHAPRYQHRQEASFPASIKSIVVVGFKAALTEHESPDLFRSPISGATFMAEPVADTIAGEMTADLFHCMQKREQFSLVPPGQAKGVYSALLSQNVTIGVADMLQETGRSFSSDAVLFGYIYRWRERIGTNYGVESPASVAFDLSLISTHTGTVVWKGSFKKTQASLSENLLDFSTFLKSRGRWLTARELADIGLEKLIKGWCY